MIKLITGGNGLIGSEFKEGIKILRNEFNLIDSVQVKKMYEQYRPDYVIHTAAKVGGVGANMNYKGEFFYENIMMNTNIIHYAKEYNVKKVLSFLSTCVFPDNIDYPLTEQKIHIGPPHSSNDAYAYAKRMVDIHTKSYNQQYGTKYFCVIPTNVYGPKDNYNLENGHVLPSIIHKCYKAIVEKKSLTLWGDGKPLREFIFSKDISKICDYLIDTYDETEPIILSTSDEISIKDLANMVTKIMGYKKEIIWDTTKPSGQYRKPSDNSKLKSLIGDFEFTSLYNGLEETIEYFLANYEKVRK
jgi:GDP-L-fucose synthase